MNEAKNLKKKINLEETAALYERVSTKHEAQKDSCKHQEEVALKYAAEHNISISPHNIYKDDGISGKCSSNRPGYQALIQAADNQEVDLIIVKTCSRLFRSVGAAEAFVQKCLLNHITLLTLEDNKRWDFTSPNELLIFYFRSIIDASVSKTQSEAGKFVQNRRVTNKTLCNKDIVTGYMWDSHKRAVLIDPKYSPYIAMIFEEYVYKNGTPASIARLLKDKDIKFPKPKRDKETKDSYVVYEYLSERTISNILSNSKYIGLFPINTRTSTFIPGEITKRSKTNPEEVVIVERPDLQIVDTELFEMAQRIRETRNHIYDKSEKIVIQARFQGTHKFAGKIYCPVCGRAYQFGFSDRKKQIPVYRIKKHSDCYNSVHRIEERDLEEITMRALKQIMEQQKSVYASIEQVLEDCVKASQNQGNDISTLKSQISSKEKQMESLIDTLAEGGLIGPAKERIKEKINALTEDINRLTLAVANKESNTLDDSYVSTKLTAIKNAITELRDFTNMDRDRILNYIERIDLQPNGDIEIFLKSGQVILAKQHTDTDSSNGNNVGRNEKQDVRY